MKRSADVVIVGGGIVGCACAYFLSQEGAKVIIVERDRIGGGATGHSPGGFGISLAYFEPPEHARFMRQGINLLKWIAPRVAEDADIDILMREVPRLEVARSEDTWGYIKEWAPRVGMLRLDADEVMRLEPRLGPPVYGGAVQEGAGQVDAYRLNLAFAKAAEIQGAKVTIDEVTGLDRSGGKVTGVRGSTDTISCDNVVLAMGAWTDKAERWVDFPLPIGPLKGEILALKPDKVTHWPFWVMSEEKDENGQEVPVFVHMRADGIIHTGVTVEPGLYDDTPTEAGRRGMMDRALRLMPCLSDAELVGHTAGPRPNPPDGTTVIGPVPGVEGAFVAASLPGIINSAIMGRTIADLIYDRPFLAPIDSFLPALLIDAPQTRYGHGRQIENRSV